MAFEKLADLSTDNVIALGGQDKKTGKKNPSSIEGYYLGSRQVESAKSKNGKAYIHVFQTPKGNVGVWGKTDSDRKILTVKPGTMTRVSHSGFQKTKNGDMYKYDVEVDKANTIEVAGLGEVSVDYADLNNSDGYRQEADSYDLDNEEDADFGLAEMEAVQASNSVAAMSSAARQQKTLDLLNKSKRK